MKKTTRITVTSRIQGPNGLEKESVKEYFVNEEQLERIQNFFDDLKKRKNEAIERMNERTRQRMIDDPNFWDKLK